METKEALAMAADNPHFPDWLRAACKDGAAEIDRRFGIGGELLIARRERDELHEQRDALLQALEIIAVGDAQNPQIQAAYELIALGYWRDIQEARIPVAAAPAVG